jgi:anaerobic magnesium-protoporphyrin IX monomethyl ester cyclase
MMISLVNYLTKNEKLEPGFYFKKNEKLINTGMFALKHHNLDSMPIIDRTLTKYILYGQNNTNFKYHPGAYTMFGRDCWWGKCTFCSWTTTHPFGTFRTCSVTHAINEIKYLSSLGIKEVFDDTGTFPVGLWLSQFCHQMINTGLNKKIVLGCNMRFGVLSDKQYQLMGKAGFRFILYGLESSNQITLDKIKKNTKTADAKNTLVLAKHAHLEPHLTIMVGYPWETKNQANKTLTEARQLFKERLADSMQATLIIPYPGTPLFSYCQKNKLLLTTNWDDYDMRQPIMKSPLSAQELTELIQGLFKGILTPKFIYLKLISIRNLSDISHLFNYTVKYLKKLRDFPKN